MLYMQHYQATTTKVNGLGSTTTTPSDGSTPSDASWADKLKDKYGIAQPMTDEDDEAEYLRNAYGALN
jgi:hypothetical protein